MPIAPRSNFHYFILYCKVFNHNMADDGACKGNSEGKPEGIFLIKKIFWMSG